MIRKFQIFTRILTPFILISLYFLREKGNLSFEILIVIYFIISIAIDLLTKVLFLSKQKKGEIFFYKIKPSKRSKTTTILTTILIISYLSYIIFIEDEIDATLYFLTFLMMYEITGYFINFNIACFIENNILYFDSVFEKPIKINNIVKTGLTNELKLLIKDSRKNKVLELKEEDSLSLKNKIEELQSKII